MPEKWSNGFLIRWRVDTLSAGVGGAKLQDKLVAYDKDGRSAFEERISVPAAASVKILDAAASLDGQIGAVGIALTAAGESAGFLAIVAKGRPIKILQTSPLEPQRVVFSRDGYAWVIGYVLNSHRMFAKSSYFTVRRYGPTGEVPGGLLPWPETDCSGGHPADSMPRWASGGDHVGLWLDGCSTWYEFSSSGQQIGIWKMSLPASANGAPVNLSGISMTADNQVFANVGPSIVSLNRSTASWDSIGWISPGTGRVIGSDGMSLVLAKGASLAWAGVQ